MSGIWVVSYVLLWGLVAVLIVLAIGLLKQLGEVQLTLGGRPSVLMTEDGVPLGEGAPRLATGPRELGPNFPPEGQKAVVLFLATTCSPCQKLVPALNDFWITEKRSLAIYTFCVGSREEVDEFGKQFSVRFPLIPDPDGVVAARFQHQRTPFGYLVDEGGIVRMKGVVNDRSMLAALAEGRGTARAEAAWKPATGVTDEATAGKRLGG